MRYSGRDVQMSPSPARRSSQPTLSGGLIMTDFDIQKSRYLLKRFHKRMKFLSGIMAQADFVMSNFEKTWTAAYLISLIKIMEKP